MGFHMVELSARAKRHHHLPVGLAAYRVDRIAPEWNQHANHAARKAGLRKGDLLVAVNGEPPPRTMSAFLAWLAQKTRPGDRIALTVVRGDRRFVITYRLK